MSTEGVIEPPAYWDRCKDKQVGDGVWKGRCVRVKGDKPQKLTFLFRRLGSGLVLTRAG